MQRYEKTTISLEYKVVSQTNRLLDYHFIVFAPPTDNGFVCIASLVICVHD